MGSNINEIFKMH